MKVYRIESKKQPCPSNPQRFAGPYTCMSDWHSLSLHRYTDQTHPNPNDDILLKPLLKNMSFKNLYCGFESIDSLKEWFIPRELFNLSNLGFIIAVYESDEVLLGEKQCLFLPEENRQILSISDYIDMPEQIIA